MGPGFGFGPPPNHEMREKLKEPKPKSIKEVPKFVKNAVVKTLRRLFYIFTLVWEAKPSLLIMMVFMTFFNGVMPVVQSLIGGELLNGLAEAMMKNAAGETAPMSVVAFPLIMLLSCQLIRSLVNSINNMVTRLSGEHVTNHIKMKIMNKAKEIDLASFDSPEFYERLENANREAGMRPVNVLNSAFSIVSTLISVVSYIAVLCTVNAWAPAVVIVISIPSAIINFHYRKKNFNYMRHRSRDRREMSYLSDMLVNKDAVKEIRLFGLADTFIGKYKEVFKRYFAGIKKLIVSEGVWNISISVFTTGVNFLLIMFFANAVRIGIITEIGDYSVYTGALDAIAFGVASLISTTATIYEGTLFIDNMLLFMKEEKTIQAREANPPEVKRHTTHKIEFKNVSFSYPGVDRKVLKNINVTIENGQTVVLVGLNGAGKTTFIKLLTRLYDPTEGVIELDGRDIRDYKPEELYRIYGIIFQDFVKYAFSVSDNISIGDIYAEYSKDRVASAAEKAGADIFINELPRGYETPLMRYFEQSGIELSIGQWQKLSIARAFYSDSDIMILDEPTASLDPMAEQEIFNRFDSLSGGKTTLFVSHRLSGATTADKILVMKNGEIAEQGTHRELMERKGEYYTLFSTQAKRYVSKEQGERINGEMPAPEFSPTFSGGAEFHRPPQTKPDQGKKPNLPPVNADGTPFAAPFGVARLPDDDKPIEDEKRNGQPEAPQFFMPFGIVPEKDE